jgi:dihydrofolate reductase
MRQIVLFNRISADGYFAGPHGELDFAVPDDELERDAVLSLPEADTILFGRKTYQSFEGFWRHALDDANTAPDPHSEGHRSEGLRKMAVWINHAHKLVFSKKLSDVTWKNAQLLRSLEAQQVEALKREAGRGIMVFGSGSIASQLTQHRLVDEYVFVVSPVALGSGTTLLRDVSKSLRLRLLEAKSYASGNVRLRYAPTA